MLYVKPVFAFFLLFLHSSFSMGVSCDMGYEKYEVKFNLGPVAITYDGRKPFPHNLSQNVRIGDFQNHVVFTGARVTKEGDIVEHNWTALEISAIAGRPLTEVELAKVKDIHMIGAGEPGKNGQAAGIDNYTAAQIGAKTREAKAAFPDLGPSAIRRLFENGVFGLVNRKSGGSSREDFLFYLDGNEYFPVFERTWQQGVLKTAEGPKSDDIFVTMNYAGKSEYLGHAALEFHSVITRTFDGKTARFPDNGETLKVYYRFEKGSIFIAMENGPWHLSFVPPKDGVRFKAFGKQGFYQWNYLGPWRSPETGTLFREAYLLENQFNKYKAIFVPGLGRVREEWGESVLLSE